MNMRKFFHVLAIMFSSLISMIAHGHAAETTVVKSKKKSGEKEYSKSHRDTGGSRHNPPQGGNDDPPARISPELMAGAEGNHPSLFQPMNSVSFPTTPPPATPTVYTNGNKENTRYPWREKIVTTTFWIGENATKNNPVPNHASSWDPAWATNYGGFDNPDRATRKDYIPVGFTPRQNPFYVALPYNDMERTGFKPEAAQIIPWFKSAYQGPMKSVCKGRWIAIRYRDRVAYAQWEDCGPFRTDHWEYVFGTERPKPNLNHGAGLDVSPAVRDYLGMNDTDVTDWRFVEFSEVPQGPWARLGDNNTFVINQRQENERLAQARDQMFRRTKIE